MLRGITARQFLDWQEFDRIDPIGDWRGDWQAASICAAVSNVMMASRGAKKRFKISDYLLEFGEAKGLKTQTWQEQKMIGQMFAAAANAEKKRKK